MMKLIPLSLIFGSWFVYAAFIGLTASLIRSQMRILFSFGFTSVLVIITIVLCFCNQETFRQPDSSGLSACFSLAASVGFLSSLLTYNKLQAGRTRVGGWVCWSALVVCLNWWLAGAGFFFPVMFCPERQLLTARVIFAVLFTLIAIISCVYFKHQKEAGSNTPIINKRSVLVAGVVVGVFFTLSMLPLLIAALTNRGHVFSSRSGDEVLIEEIHNAKREGNLDALQSFRKNPHQYIVNLADGALQSSAPSPKLLRIFETMLNSETDQMDEGRGMAGIYILSRKLGLQPHSNLPGIPNGDDFNNSPDYWVKVWRDWLASNKDKLIKMMERETEPTPNTK